MKMRTRMWPIDYRLRCKGKSIFSVNKRQRIEIWYTSPFRSIKGLEDDLTVYFINGKKRYELVPWTDPFVMSDHFFAVVNMVAQEDAALREYSNVDHGYLLNIYYAAHWFKEAKKYSHLLPDNWIEDKYVIFNGRGDGKGEIATWLYSTQEGDIFFEITPIFPGLRAKINAEKYTGPTFDQFMDSYQPIVKIKIAKKTVKAWDLRLQRLVKKLQASTR